MWLDLVRYEVEIAEYREAAITGSMQQQAMIEKLEAENAHLRSEVEQLRGALEDIAGGIDVEDASRIRDFARLHLKEAEDANGAT